MSTDKEIVVRLSDGHFLNYSFYDLFEWGGGLRLIIPGVNTFKSLLVLSNLKTSLCYLSYVTSHFSQGFVLCNYQGVIKQKIEYS